MQKIRPDMDFGRAIERIRRNSKLTQREVVLKMQFMGLTISESTYAKIETNRMNIKASELVALKLIFNVTFDEFFNDLVSEVHSLRKV